jgi:hypothetical protein
MLISNSSRAIWCEFKDFLFLQNFWRFFAYNLFKEHSSKNQLNELEINIKFCVFTLVLYFQRNFSGSELRTNHWPWPHVKYSKWCRGGHLPRNYNECFASWLNLLLSDPGSLAQFQIGESISGSRYSSTRSSPNFWQIRKQSKIIS